jgi:putative addiction module component (TIGR02574 family)
MNKSVLLGELMQLDAGERLDIAEKLWDSVHPPGSARPGEVVVITEEQLAEAERRFEAYQRDPSRASPANEVMKRIRARFE